MAQPVIQHSFHAGEWAPALNARVDLQKYRAGAALMKNFFVDYRGGASTRPGTKYCLQAFKSATAVRLIPFQASFTVSYILEFGDQYIRFFNNGNAVLEASTAITNATGNTVTATNNYVAGDWVFITGVNGITNINNRYFIVASATGTSYTVTDLYGGAVTFAGTYTSGGTTARVYTLASPYTAADLPKIKFAQNVNKLILCHPNYTPQVLTIVAANNWTIGAITFGTTLSAPTGVSASTSLGAGGGYNYSYIVTAADDNGQESPPSAAATLANFNDMRNSAGTTRIQWNAVPGATSYNVYKAELTQTAAVPAGAAHGFIGNCTGLDFRDSNITPDFSLTFPTIQFPFLGGNVTGATITAAGTYTAVPTISFAPPTVGLTAAGVVSLGAVSGSVAGGGTGYSVGQIVRLGFGNSGSPDGATLFCTINVTGVTAGAITSFTIANPGSITSGSTPSNPLKDIDKPINYATINITWGVTAIVLTTGGAGYTSAPAITFSGGTATATATINSGTNNPAVPTFFQQRLVLANTSQGVQTFYMSQPGSYYNFNVTKPVEPDNAITGSIVSGQLNEIKSAVPVPVGLILLTSRSAWLINSGSAGNAAVTPIDISANAHSYNGASDLPPIVANFDILFVQAKGSIVRDLTFNFYAQIYTGTDISVLSSHLFYGHTLTEWCWAEEPFKVVWAVRDDGVMLTLTFLKEQELIGWAQQTTNGLFKSVATVTEPVSFGSVDAVYTVVQRTINGQTLKYIERVVERIFPNGDNDAWCVDAGIQYVGSPTTSFSGAYHLAGATVTGVADGVPIAPFTMATSGSFTLGSAASKVTIGLAYTPQLKTLQLDLGEPTVQGKRKKIPAVTVRVQDALGLSIGKSFSSLVPMKDLVIGNVNGPSNSVVADLFTGDARTLLDPSWDVPGQYCIQQSNPLPATVLGVIPEIAMGDTPK